MPSEPTDTDYLLVGGGLQAGLLVMALRHHQPRASVLLIEQNGELAGNHTWSFHPQDVPETAKPWVSPLIEHRWSGYDVRLTGFFRRLGLSYASISSGHFADVIARQFRRDSLTGDGILLGHRVARLGSNCVTLDNGQVCSAKVVIDCRGPHRSAASLFARCGYQKLWGFEIRTEVDWPRSEPTVMDDSVDQADGFRFIYSLPFEPRRILVEDTRFSNSACIDRLECLETVRSYLNKLGIHQWEIVREESGVLPMPASSESLPGSMISDPDGVLAGGYAGHWFHAATGYSFPFAVAFAETVATASPGQTAAALTELASRQRWRSLYGRFLNRLLFYLVKPTTRYQIFRRFYRVLSQDAVARFYAHQFKSTDAAKIIIGMPPGGLRPLRFLKSWLGADRSEPRGSYVRPAAMTLHSEKT